MGSCRSIQNFGGEDEWWLKYCGNNKDKPCVPLWHWTGDGVDLHNANVGGSLCVDLRIKTKIKVASKMTNAMLYT